jgi:hypothetical protein
MRMNRRVAILLVASFACESLFASEVDPAVPVLRMYVSAFRAVDCELVWRLTSSAVKRRDKTGQFREMLCALQRKMRDAQFVEQLEPPIAHLSDGSRRAVFVPATRVTKAEGWAPEIQIIYVVHSSDHGQTWEVLDLSCTDERWIREIYPRYQGWPQLPMDHVRLMSFLPE